MNLERVCIFFCTLYVPYFVSGSIGSDAPKNDLDFLKNLYKLSSVDQEIADSAKSILLRHTWYLQEETIPMALFSDLLSLDEKSELAATILTFESKKPYHWNLRRPGEEDNSYQIGKPILELDLDENTSLKDLVGSNSFLIFDLLNLSWD